MIATYKDIKLTYPDDMPLIEAERYCQDEISYWANECTECTVKVIASVTITLDGDEVIVSSKERSPITRTARVTGYLSNTKNFSNHKAAELKARVKHC